MEQYHLLPIMVSGVTCIISPSYRMFSWPDMTQEHSYPTWLMGGMASMQ